MRPLHSSSFQPIYPLFTHNHYAMAQQGRAGTIRTLFNGSSTFPTLKKTFITIENCYYCMDVGRGFDNFSIIQCHVPPGMNTHHILAQQVTCGLLQVGQKMDMCRAWVSPFPWAGEGEEGEAP